ncbi:arylamine N-acetyltransferase family protein [Glycomyces tenuis]|uniref:arylamine N-acetyltransferase family protein n=1 Tax=Glycomyces tenuis TaxID=58116 RepID=UPI00138B1481|nr:arylamine N-acetyltransferase [Glycomyces tenuis]
MFSSTQLDAYLERIGLARPKRPTADALVRIHRAHIDTFPYENIDIQLGRAIGLDEASLFDKLVLGGRGGFCFEQNGLLALALEAMGFTVRRLCGGVGHEHRGDEAWFNHLPLLVTLREGRYIADAGLGVGFRDPLPFQQGSHRVGPFNYGLWNIDGELWRCTVDPRVENLSFDFELDEHELGDFAAKCAELETSPESGFVNTLSVQQPRADHVLVLRARTVTVFDPKLPEGKSARVLDDAEAFAELLAAEFGLSLPERELAALWDRARAQHQRWKARRSSNAEPSLP